MRQWILRCILHSLRVTALLIRLINTTRKTNSHSAAKPANGKKVRVSLLVPTINDVPQFCYVNDLVAAHTLHLTAPAVVSACTESAIIKTAISRKTKLYCGDSGFHHQHWSAPKGIGLLLFYVLVRSCSSCRRPSYHHAPYSIFAPYYGYSTFSK